MNLEVKNVKAISSPKNHKKYPESPKKKFGALTVGESTLIGLNWSLIGWFHISALGCPRDPILTLSDAECATLGGSKRGEKSLSRLLLA